MRRRIFVVVAIVVLALATAAPAFAEEEPVPFCLSPFLDPIIENGDGKIGAFTAEFSDQGVDHEGAGVGNVAFYLSAEGGDHSFLYSIEVTFSYTDGNGNGEFDCEVDSVTLAPEEMVTVVFRAEQE